MDDKTGKRASVAKRGGSPASKRGSTAKSDKAKSAAPKSEKLKRDANRKRSWEMRVLRLRDQMQFILDAWVSGRGRYEAYEHLTGIPASRWRNLCLNKQLPTVDMVMAVVQYNPEIAEWLLAAGTADNRGLERFGGPSAWASFLKERQLLEECRLLRKERHKR